VKPHRLLTVPAVVVALLAVPSAARAQSGGCLTADPPPLTQPSAPLRFGITPGEAGSFGTGQGQVAPIDAAKETRALLDLRAPGRELVLRLNRLFWADGDAAIRRFEGLVDRYAAAGLRSEIQVRYHPPEGAAGDMARWEGFVRDAVRRLGGKPSVVGFSITNEANFPLSPNTSDGAYEGVVDALVRGITVARQELVALGRGSLDLGFNVMWRWTPEGDAAFWREVGAKATPEFRRALTYVGLQVYPGLVWPPLPRPGVPAGEEVVEALTLVRGCFMPMAGMGREVPIWVSENGYPTNAVRAGSETSQASALESTLDWVHRYSGELGVTDYRWFNLRDNNSDGTDYFAAVGLLRDDYSRKPAFGVFRTLNLNLGSAPQQAPVVRRRARMSLSVRRGAGRRLLVRGRVMGGPCAGDRVRVRVLRGRRTVASRRLGLRESGCRFATVLRVQRLRAVRVEARFSGNAALAPARASRRVRT
jgi:hypothetical protein